MIEGKSNMTGNIIKKMIADVYLLRRNYVSDDLQKAIDVLADYSDVSHVDHKFRSGMEYNGWVVPKKWEVKEAKIFHKQKVVYDAIKHPLGVAMQSCSFHGKLSLAGLKKHLFSAENRPNAIPYHFRIQYRPWIKDWGICLPKSIQNTFPDGEYEVVLRTAQTPGNMVVREFILPGESKKTILFVAHIDHPGMANDDVSGCAVGIALLNEIKKQYPQRNYTYKLILTQEIVGSVFYLHGLTAKERKNVQYALFLEMLGNDNDLILQSSLEGNTYFDTACTIALKHVSKSPRICGFRESAGNDEIVFESPGYEIPTPSISRWPYQEYHTSDDNMDIIFEKKLEESLAFLLEIVYILEHDCYVKRNFSGLVSLANPKYNLYIDPGQIVDGPLNKNTAPVIFQYKMPRYLDGKHRISEIAEIFQLDFRWVYEYFQKMESKNLVTLEKN